MYLSDDAVRCIKRACVTGTDTSPFTVQLELLEWMDENTGEFTNNRLLLDSPDSGTAHDQFPLEKERVDWTDNGNALLVINCYAQAPGQVARVYVRQVSVYVSQERGVVEVRANAGASMPLLYKAR